MMFQFLKKLLFASTAVFVLATISVSEVMAQCEAEITSQPVSSTICANANTTFSVGAFNATAYQWQQNSGSGFTDITNGGVFSGATTSTLTITGATSGMSGFMYRVVVTGICGPDITSVGVTLTVNVAPSITSQPTTSSICASGNATFTVAASNATGYQWQENSGSGYTNITNGGIYSGATTSTLTITGATAGMNGYVYRAVASGACTPSAATGGATLTVNIAPSITSQPTTSTICANGNATFTVGASNVTGFQWQENSGSGYTNITNGGVYSGATTSTLIITGATAGMSGYMYRAVASGACNPSATTGGVTLTVNVAPSITSQPTTSIICASGNATFTVAASNATGYQWQENSGSGYTNITNGGIYSGATTSTLTITGATAGMNGYAYRAVASGACNPSATTGGATLTVNSIVVTKAAQTNVACFGGATGAATINTPTGGAGGYTYNWTPGNPTGDGTTSVTGLTAGTWTVTVTDANSCTAIQTFTITQPPALNGSTVVTNVACNGNNTGAINLTPSGGTPGYTFDWGGGITTEDRTGLTAGTYSVTITDANGCTKVVSATVTQPTAVSGTTVVTNVACNGGATGAINLTPTGGTPGYTFNWGGGITTEDRTGLSAGTYSVTITDANGCTGTVSVTVTQPPVINGTTVVTNVACNGGATGAINLTPSGGTPGYTFNWGDGVTTEDRTGLSAGTYTVIITDANGCTKTVSATVTQPTAVSGTTVTTNVACNGGATGAINLTPTGGTPGYTFNWGGGITTEDRTGLSAGTYSVTITDANGCTGTVSVTVTQPPAMVVTASAQTNVSCFGGNTGAASINTPTGGAGGYTYNWTPGNPVGDGTTSVTGLSAGTWTVTVTDANGCTASQAFTVTQPPALGVTASAQTNVSCFGGSNGAASINTPTGGAGGYTYNWTPGNPTGDGTTSVTGLSAGTWTVTVTDANGCTASQAFTVTQPPALGVTASAQTNVSCFGGSNGAASINTPTGGAGGYTYNWTPGNPTGDGTTSVTGLSAGTWTVTVTDANGCTASQAFTVTQPPSLVVSPLSQTNVSCFGGSNGAASINTPTGGAGGYTYNWSPGTPIGDGTTSVSGLIAGTWTVTVTDANSCTATQTFTITQPPALVVTPLSQTNVSCFGGSNGAASINTPTGGAGGYTYNWTPGNPVGDGTANVTGLTAGTWTVTVTDANGCTASQAFTVTQPSAVVSGTMVVTNVSCNGGANGAINLTPSGGSGGYTYNWLSGGPTTEDRTGLVAGTYTVMITDANGCTGTVSGTVTEPPTLVASAGAKTDVSCNGGATGSATVNVTGGTPGYTYLWAPVGGTAATASGLSAGTYTATVTDANGCSATQTFIINQPGEVVLATATLPQGNVAAAYNNTFTATGGSGIFTYEISAGALPIGLTLSTGGILSGTPTTAGTFNFMVKATENGCNQFTSTAYSITIAAGSQTITFNAIPNKTFGDAPFTLTGTTNSGLTINYSSSNNAVATISGDVLTIVGAGTTNITAAQTGNANYTAASPVVQQLVVDKATATIVLSNLTQTYDGTSKPVTATTTPPGLSGVNITYDGNAAVPSAAGNYAVVADLTNTNYTAVNATGSLSIFKQNQAITFAPLADKTFNDAPFALTATGGGSGNAITYVSANTAIATVSGNMVTIVGAGTVNITASQAANSNYNAAADVVQSLTIAKANQTIAFSTLPAKTFGDPAFTLSATGGTSGNPVTFASSNPAVATVSGSTVTIVGTGTVNITAAQAGNANYNAAADVIQSLTVGKANQTIVFSTLPAKTFGDPAFTLSATGGASGNPVTFASSNPAVATVSGSTVTIVGTGTVNITAAQAGNANYNAAADVIQPLTVGKANQTIAFSTLPAKTFGDPAFTLSATGGASSNPVTFASSNTAVATVSGSTVTIVGTGTVNITAAQAGNANYNAAADVIQSLTVGKANQTIAFSTLPAKTFGDPAFTLSATGGASGNPVTFASSNPAVATVSGNTVTIVGTGTVNITAAQAGNANYNASADVIQPLTVGKANQTIAFSTLPAKTFGDPAFTLSATGGASGNPVTFASSNTAVATVSGNTVTLVGAGTVNITASQAGNANYNAATNVVQQLVVNSSADASLSALSTSTGSLDPAFNGSTLSYGFYVNNAVNTITLTPTAVQSASTIKVNNVVVASGNASAPVALAVGLNTITVNVLAGNGIATKNYTVKITRLEQDQVLNTSGSTTVSNSVPEVFVTSATQPVTVTVPAGVTNPTVNYETLVNAGTATLPSTTINSAVASIQIPAATTVVSSNPAWDGVLDAPTVTTYTIPATPGQITSTGLIIEVGDANSSLSFDKAVRVKLPGEAGKLVAFVHGGIYTEIINTGSADTQAAGNALPADGAFKIDSGADLIVWTKVFSTFITFTRSTDPDIALVAADKALLTDAVVKATNSDLSTVIANLNTPATGSNGSVFTWSSNNTAVVSNAGVVNRPLSGSGNATVTLTVTIKKGLITDTKTFNVIVVQAPNQAPTMAAINAQVLCATTAGQTVALTGITPGPETSQTTTLSVTSNNAAMFSALTVTGTGSTGTVRYTLNPNATGVATVTVTVKDNGGTANGGTDTFTRTFTVTANALPAVNIASDLGVNISKGATARLTVAAQSGVTYTWTNTAGVISGQNTAALTIRPTVSGIYTLTATNASGCTTVSSIAINVVEDYKTLLASNILTPNGDGVNDKWVIANLDMYPNNVVKVFDRAGRVIFTEANYKNTWDATVNGSPLTEGTYFYTVSFGPGKLTLKGFITVVRDK